MKAVCAALFLQFCVTTALFAQVSGGCKVNKDTEILCTIEGQTRGILVDIRPRVPRVQADIDTYYETCGHPRFPVFGATHTFAQEPGRRDVWYRYNRGFAPVENRSGEHNRNATCIRVFILRCHEVKSNGDKEPRPCGEVLDANGFIFDERSEG